MMELIIMGACAIVSALILLLIHFVSEYTLNQIMKGCKD